MNHTLSKPRVSSVFLVQPSLRGRRILASIDCYLRLGRSSVLRGRRFRSWPQADIDEPAKLNRVVPSIFVSPPSSQCSFQSVLLFLTLFLIFLILLLLLY